MPKRWNATPKAWPWPAPSMITLSIAIGVVNLAHIATQRGEFAQAARYYAEFLTPTSSASATG